MKRPRVSMVVAALLILAALSAAHAEEAERWYGWQIMLADAATVALLTRAPAALYLVPFDGALVHLGNDEPVKAVASVGIRAAGMLGGFLAGVAVGGATQGQCDDECDIGAVIDGLIGGTVGFGVAAVVDWTVLARKEAAPLERPFAVHRVGFTPRAGGGVVAVSGAF